MNRYGLGLLAVVGLVASTLAADKADADLEKLQGTWKLVSAEFGGKTFPDPVGRIYVFSNDKKVVMKVKGKAVDHHTFKVDASKSPKELDLIDSKEKGKEAEVIQNIYQIDGDTLKVGHSAEGSKGKRPAGFGAKNIVIITLKRQKP